MSKPFAFNQRTHGGLAPEEPNVYRPDSKQRISTPAERYGSAINKRHRPRSAPLEREEFLGLAFHKHYVPQGRRSSAGGTDCTGPRPGGNVSIRVNKIRTQASLSIDEASIDEARKMKQNEGIRVN
jgi:hypothetical protein